MKSVELTKIFRSKQEFKNGMEEIKHFYPPCQYEYEIFETQAVFPKPSRRINHGVNVYRREVDTKEFCKECEFYNYDYCDRPEE